MGRRHFINGLLSLAESKQLLAGIQREIVAAQARLHAMRRPACPGCGDVCRMKDYRQHAIATLFGQVAVRLPRFRCAGCDTIEAGVGWPPHVRSTPELDRLRARPPTGADAIVVTLDSTFIRSCEDGERHLETLLHGYAKN